MNIDEAELIKRIRNAIYNTWHNGGIADVNDVARIAAGVIRPFLRNEDRRVRGNFHNLQKVFEALMQVPDHVTMAEVRQTMKEALK